MRRIFAMSRNERNLQGNESSQDIINIFSQNEELTQRLKKLKKQPWRTFYSTFISKSHRKAQVIKANILQKRHVAKLWNFFLDQYFAGKLNYFELKSKKQFNDEKIIWQYWGQGIEDAQKNKTVNLCFSAVDRYKGGYQVIRLDNQTIKEYLDLPDFVWKNQQNPQFKPAFFADLIRLALLDVYGGIWIDATILLTAPIEEEILKQDCFMFQRDERALNKDFWQQFNNDYFGWGDQHIVNILNSFIVAKKNSQIIHTCLDIMLNYWQTQKDIPHYFIFQIMMNELLKRKLFKENILLIDDTLPHLLQVKLNEPFDINEYNKIISVIHIHKLTYVKESVKDSYFEYIKNTVIN